MESKSFKRGDIVRNGNHCILVTGKGDKRGTAGYPCFSGVVIMSKKTDDEDDSIYPIGLYSLTWNNDAFKKVKINLSDCVYAELIGK